MTNPFRVVGSCGLQPLASVRQVQPAYWLLVVALRHLLQKLLLRATKLSWT
jgi:hypothetical protein